MSADFGAVLFLLAILAVLRVTYAIGAWRGARRATRAAFLAGAARAAVLAVPPPPVSPWVRRALAHDLPVTPWHGLEDPGRRGDRRYRLVAPAPPSTPPTWDDYSEAERAELVEDLRRQGVSGE
jgi:hypothetical protein